MVGIRGNRNAQDEKLVAAIFSTSKPRSHQTNSLAQSIDSASAAIAEDPSENVTPSGSFERRAQMMQDEAIAKVSQASDLDDSFQSEDNADPPRVYGATQHNLIVDARPTVNAYAMQAVGMGSENMDNYRFATKAYLGIDNIHVMRDSLNKVVDALKESDVTPLPPNRELLVKSGWLKHIANMLDGVSLIARQVGLHHSHVLIHCSDGWDRTSQLSALSQLCLDPYFRTLEGFIVLVEKDWLSFGHMFRHRSGFLGSEKWFEIENERIGGSRVAPTDSGSPRPVGNAFENALLSAKGFFGKHKNDSRESLVDSDNENGDASSSRRNSASIGRSKGDDKMATKVKETSPVFHQFLDATYQLLHQHPTRFEFNERFLRRLLYHLYSCQYGTFLYDNEKQRVDAKVQERTRSVWDYFLARKPMFMNDQYDATIDDNVPGQERLVFPDPTKTRWWAEVFGRTDEEMNSPRAQTVPANLGASTLTGVETAEVAVGAGSAETAPNVLKNGAAAIAAGFQGMNLSAKTSTLMPRVKSSESAREQMEVEMQ